ncbi:hypothetical protein V8B55DRAFT_1562600 [Mucor lusitanicus]|uniref:F-box domain-containing protein n=2 Tax=Mucor circinelloides f. lusitanicus TaxID=29924 RepID=A0A162RG99_MUCCL|nr:hypothetical protein MUCCIDRAFT_108855 [Mucor lusitanicus CBS 277.49]
MFVCKSWHPTAAQIYFSDLLLPLHRPKKLSGLLNSPSAALCIRTLKIHGVQSYQQPFGGQELRQLIGNMPYLNKLCFDTYDTQAHLETLSQIPLDQLRNVKEIHIGHHGTSNEIERLYIANTLRLCDNIEHLRLQQLRIQFEANRLNLIQCLAHFKRLKHLVLTNSTRSGGIADLDLASVASVCPYLEKLDFRSYFPALLVTRQAQPSHPLKYLKSLTLGIPDLYSSYLAQLMDYITFSTLDSLTLELYEASLKHWVDDCVFESMKTFAKRISSLKNVKISISTLPERMTLASLVLKEATVSLWEVMNILRNDRPLFGCVVIDLDNVRFNRLNPCIQVIDNQVIKLRTCLSYPNIANSNNSFTWDPFFSANTLHHGLPFINSLCVDFTLFYSKSLRRMIQLLECLLSRCHWLKYLYIGSNVSSMLFCPADALSSLERPSNAEYKIKRIDTKTPVTTRTKENLKCASFESMQISSYLLEVMSILLNIHTLKISRCYYDRDISGAIVLNLQEILYIPRLELTLDCWDKARQIFPLLIKIQMAQDHTLYYQCRPQQHILSLNQPSIDGSSIFDYNIVIHVKCQRVDVVSLYNAAGTNFALFEPWSDYLSSMSSEELVQ